MTTNADGRPGGLPTAAYLRQLADARPDSRPIRLRDHASALEFSPDGRWLVITELARVILLPLSQQGPVLVSSTTCGSRTSDRRPSSVPREVGWALPTDGATCRSGGSTQPVR